MWEGERQNEVQRQSRTDRNWAEDTARGRVIEREQERVRGVGEYRKHNHLQQRVNNAHYAHTVAKERFYFVPHWLKGLTKLLQDNLQCLAYAPPTLQILIQYFLVAITRCVLRHPRSESKICQPWPLTQMFTQLKDAAMQAVHAFLYAMSIHLGQA